MKPAVCQPLAISPPEDGGLGRRRVCVEQLRVVAAAERDDFRLLNSDRAEFVDAAGNVVFEVTVVDGGVELGSHGVCFGVHSIRTPLCYAASFSIVIPFRCAKEATWSVDWFWSVLPWASA